MTSRSFPSFVFSSVLLTISLLVGYFYSLEQSTTTKYLLLDERLIDHTENARMVVGTVRKHEANPLFIEDKPWEKRFDNLYGNVLYDSTSMSYRLWYSPFIVDYSAKDFTLAQRLADYNPPEDREMAICYAISSDGIQWTKPDLGLVIYEGNARNNIVWRGPHGAGIYYDPYESDPEFRFKTMFQGLSTSTSADGLKWSPPKKCTSVTVAGDTHNNTFWAPTEHRYVGITRTWGSKGRQVARTESEDFVHWTKEKLVMEGTSLRDQPYAMPVFYHEGLYLGLLAIYNRESDRTWTELAWSPDSKDWRRISPGVPLIPNSEEPLAYDYGCVYACATPVFLENEIRLYYGGSDWLHFGWRNGSLCLATLRPDGFAGYEPQVDERMATVLTRPVYYKGGMIEITTDVYSGGSVIVTVFDEDGNRLQTASPVINTGTDIPLEFEHVIPPGNIKLQLVLDQAKIYAFQFVD